MTTEQRLSLATRLLEDGRYAASARLVAPLTVRAPRTKDDLAAQRILARSAYALGRLAEAEQAAGRVVRRRPKDAAMMRLIVRVLQREGRHRDAAGWMTRLDELGSDTWDDGPSHGTAA
ncbi:MAG TPA: tetratricopeptide repeat protein [Tetrasphaera sp.]|uniref:Tetratricopeptide repeat protein n=1 Tax=Nostocoides vanveenii TaxID=330835 RepID=A0ABN2JZW6_9MICO|nr:tetratricopeptide repeat protein [Tetrasphaera sp.]HNQ08524.1 tetratricopeptide repeat protein [Tetrasphaera sp.]